MPLYPAAVPHAPGVDAAIGRRLAELERQVRTLGVFLNGGVVSAIAAVDSNGVASRPGRIHFNKSDGKLYVDNGTMWVPQT